MLNEVGEHLGRRKAAVVGPAIAPWHKSSFIRTDANQEEMDVETASPTGPPIGGPVPERGRVQQVPKGKVAYAVHCGDLGGLLLAWLLHCR